VETTNLSLKAGLCWSLKCAGAATANLISRLTSLCLHDKNTAEMSYLALTKLVFLRELRIEAYERVPGIEFEL